jgi:hypothetical protein
MIPDPLAAAARGLAVFGLEPGGRHLLGPGRQHATPPPPTPTRSPRPGAPATTSASAAGRAACSASGTTPLGPGIDTRGPGVGGRGGYLVGPGSVVGGIVCTLERDLPIAVVPGWLADLLERPVPNRRTA